MTDSARTHEKLRALVDTNLSAAGAGIDLLILAKHLAEVGPSSTAQSSNLDGRLSDRSNALTDARHAVQDDAGSARAELDSLSTIKHLMELSGSIEGQNPPGGVDVAQEVVNAMRLLDQLPSQ